MNRRRFVVVIPTLILAPALARAHHGWSRFDETKPIYLEGTIKTVKWQDPHAEVTMEINHAAPPAGLASLASPKQQANVDAKTVLGRAVTPTRKDKLWEVEFAPIFRMGAWKTTEPKPGDKLAVVGYTFADEKGSATLRVEFWIQADRAVPMRSMPA
jgi:hypothetical protein